ncbi:mitochondrial 54S ribosomal protein bL32m NDAI_0G04390 [Naumovozyma dairenensis CBS 421]|uniref:Large ribosomal subunit protein bL32m n=1 Tax=Naumovozyma dairenensis (strain ATCC 10597 / BCRC 20456 / CBS 421 / NBRC 0211 / NRRL Y-12639) TaxID=1071378 RepID=J7REA0_NAUDC|nr:hypothetical protein NDAI_0G04390 [Naumovozyma dairenensis CBS 421]CCK73424.1 hypothetical protein NDAI_0G04390 [Naumovozyma dairenensis CBS 421]
MPHKYMCISNTFFYHLSPVNSRLLQKMNGSMITRTLSSNTSLTVPIIGVPKVDAQIDTGSIIGQWLRKKLFGEENGSSNGRGGISIDTGILKAVPKKKVSHQKKRQRLYAPGSKQVKMINNLNKCPSCGHYKRAHTLCMYCVGEIRRIWNSQTRKPYEEPPQERELSDVDKRILYPGKKLTKDKQKLLDRDSYLERRMRTLSVEKKK